MIIYREILYQLKREVSFVNSLPLDITAIAVGWIYTILWIVCYYPQVFFWGKKEFIILLLIILEYIEVLQL